jgi:4-hydroxy-4-methyl-2-oxoglutarate aldolase
MSGSYDELAQLGAATIYEAAGRKGLIGAPLTQLIPGSRVAGPARIARCGQGDNLMVHAVLSEARPGDVVVLSMPKPEPVALIGELLVTQAKVRGVAAFLVDAAVRDADELVDLGVPIWTRYVSMKGATKQSVGAIDEPVVVGDAEIRPGDVVVLDRDGVVVVAKERLDEVTRSARERVERERVKRSKLEQGALSYDLDDLRTRVEVEGDQEPAGKRSADGEQST